MENREIKFRSFYDGEMFYSHNNDFNPSKFQLVWFFNKCHENAIIMQFTGLLDRDGNGIYEGDIIKCSDENLHVIFNTSMGQWDLEFRGGDSEPLVSQDGWDGEMFKVIGNIYQNPELLK